MKEVVAKLKRVPVQSVRCFTEELREEALQRLRRKRKKPIPPVLLVRGSTFYRPLDGNNRVTHARSIGKTYVWAYVITQREYRRLRARLNPWWYGDLDDDIWVSKRKTYADLHIRT